MKFIKQFLLLVSVLAVLLATVLFWQMSQFLKSPISEQSKSVVIEIKSGSSAQHVANLLHQKGVLSSPKWFTWYLRYQEKHHLLKAGEIMIQPYWSVDELIEHLIKGDTVQYPVTLIAGQTVQQALATIQVLPKIKKTLDIKDIKALQALLGVSLKVNPKYPYASLEGRLLPETYHYQAGDTDKQLILRAHNALKQRLESAWQQREKGLPIKTPYDALILASIVEKETGIASERAKIAGVFINRMRRGMRLQTDPTVIYGIGMSYDGNIRKRDLQTKTLYNTYKIDGLPPTPIALPSKEAINAVMHPEKTKALYFVAKGGGEHYFSNTLVEHNRAVRKYLLNKK
ncbi:FIG004453: protein YceG like [hydrothermal vent metagenome]|uniref:FIG004453: protein YceG like n=1 Tax=hydrothermal vent metagenome TaxID=652676 RepID=A0A3B0W0M9_9ZZZZ